jgi:hypothetical protein
MSYGFILIGVMLVVLLATIGRLGDLHTKEFTEALHKGLYDKANGMSKQGSWIFRVHVLVMLALAWWLWQVARIMGVA